MFEKENLDYLTLLREHFYFQVPFPVETYVVQDAVDAFMKFLKEPENVKSHIKFSIAPKHRRGEVGYQKRVEGDHIYNDNKEFFHYHPAILGKYSEFIRSNPNLEDFLNKATPLWEATYRVVKEVLCSFESVFPGTYNKIFATNCVHIVLRFLKYDWQKSQKYLAKPHYDAGSFSLAIAESCPGLRIGSGPLNLKMVEHKPNQAIFMLSSNFKKVFEGTKNNDFSAGWHDVIQVDETQVGKPFARWAVVAFIEAHGVEALERTETHKWFFGSEFV